MKCFFAKGRVNSDGESPRELFVNNCGYYKGLDEPLEIARPKGRQDYHLLFCVRGAITVGDERLETGDAYLFFPHREQRYVYLSASDALYFWVHFTGTRASDMLKHMSLLHGKYGCAAHLSELETLLQLLSNHLGAPFSTSDDLAAGLLSAILALLPCSASPQSPFASAIRALDDLSAEVSVSGLADMYKMSKGHFIRSFRSYFGITPYQYRRKKQLDLAKMLLSETNLPIAQIALRVGLDDSLYFSRVFKKYVGRSPSVYRRS